MLCSFIIPLYNRPHEIKELLESFCTQPPLFSYSIIIIEDGSTLTSKHIIEEFPHLPLIYQYQSNTGPAGARNHGVQKALDQAHPVYCIFLDSDTVLPPTYFEALYTYLTKQATPPDIFGGPDAAHPSFTTTQQAINYAMTSFLTTGGIRGGKKRMDIFYPRSFNMGVRSEVFQAVQGFDTTMRFGEDVDFSMRVVRTGYTSVLIPEAFVWHKRRATLTQFFKQVHNSGIARVHLSLRHPGTFKIVHVLPSLFTVFCTLCCTLAGISCMTGNIVSTISILAPLVLIAHILFLDALRSTKSMACAWKSVQAGYVQLLGYGSGFLVGVVKRILLRKHEFSAFQKTFYK